ncbi:MAG TPA: hypothetical protein VJ869_03235 [Sphaerochaeta sp.]|nr:hypothetical protein [Sphaerochaeta sp.]
MIVVKSKSNGMYLGKSCVRGERQAVENISRAKRYQTESSARRGMVLSRGQVDFSKFEFVEVTE